jgi:radical SAM superfamily enzyme YgiQ (UPF0313 family)
MYRGFDSAIIFECTNSTYKRRGAPVRERTHVIRPLGPFALNEVFVNRGIPSTVINYTEFWDPDKLFDSVSAWLEKNSAKNPLILASSLFDIDFISSDTVAGMVAERLQAIYPNSKVIIGGPVSRQHLKNKPYAIFQGRSLHLFEQWLDEKDIPSENVNLINGILYFQNKSFVVVEDPIVPQLYDDYCLTDRDIVLFETRLGCKFNCSFCSFEFRNAKKVADTTAERLHKFFLDAYNKYGLTRFSVADDTFNEDDQKIFMLQAATRGLPFKPQIVGYNRFDIMMAKPWQVEALDQCGYVGHYFGIETLHLEASKAIRKGIRKERAYEFMSYLRDSFPHWWTSSGYIVGLPYEPTKHIRDTFAEICDQKLLKALIPSPLVLFKPEGYHDAQYSEFVKEPEKFGIQVTGREADDCLSWHHEIIDSMGARVLAKRLASYVGTNKLETICGWEWLTQESVGYGIEAADRHIHAYISRKAKFLESR